MRRLRSSGAPAPGSGGFVGAVVAAQIGVQIGAFTLPALLPGLIARWQLSNTEAGWIVGIFFAAYVPAVPVLVALTDRIPARRIYLAGAALTALSHLGFATVADGFWSALLLRALAGFGWAGAYMPGLRVLTDALEGAAQSRAVSWHAAGVGVAGAMSFALAGLLDGLGGPAAAFLFGAIAACLSFAIAAVVMPMASPSGAAAGAQRLLDFRPVFRNRQAMAWIAGYAMHTLEMAALRAWAVTFLAATGARLGAPAWIPAPSLLFALAGLVGIGVSVSGNEAAQRHGRTRVVLWAMSVAAAFSLLAGWTSGLSYLLAVAVVMLWNMAIYLDSAALTAGTVQSAERPRRGATMGLHSMAGYAGGFIGPLGVGWILDLAGGDRPAGWGLAFGHLAVITLSGLAVLRRLGREP